MPLFIKFDRNQLKIDEKASLHAAKRQLAPCIADRYHNTYIIETLLLTEGIKYVRLNPHQLDIKKRNRSK